MTLLKIKNLRVQYKSLTGDTTALQGLDFELHKGEVVGLVGESGSGKSTAGLALMGLLDKYNAKIDGAINIEGIEKDILQLSEKELCSIRGAEIGMVFQDPMTSLNPYLRIGFQIMEPLLCHGYSKVDAYKRAIELLTNVEISNPKEAMQSYPHHFSGGMRQRVMIAAALAARPKILIADEPTTALDVITQKKILELFSQRIKDNEMGVILITHDLGIVAQLCDRVVVLKDGEVVEQASSKELFNNPQHSYTKALLDAVPRLDAPLPRRELPQGVILEVNKLSVSYQGRKEGLFKKTKKINVVKGASLKINQGEILGLVGQSGSGKSTLLKAVANLLPVESGSIHFEKVLAYNLSGQNLNNHHRNVQMIFQDPRASLDGRMVARDIVAEPLINFGICKKAEARKRALELMKMVNLDLNSAQRYPHEFSGGQCQRIGIARALIVEPKLLLCDEPVSALDVSIQAEVLELLMKLQRDLRLSMLFVSHDLAVVRNFAHRVAVMHNGEIVETSLAERIYTNPRHNYTKELLRAIPIAEVK